MKRSAKHIITVLYALSALTMYLSCTREEIPAVMPEGSNLAINTKADGVPVFAYLPEELKAGNYTAIAPATQKSDNYYYKIPDGTTKVIFSNLSGKETERVKFTGNEAGLVSIAVKSDEIITSDILLGSIGDFIIGNDNPYSIQLKRLNAEFETKLQVVNDKNEELNASSVFKSVSVNINHIATQINITEDLAYTASGDADTTLAMSASGYTMSTSAKKFIPSANKCELTVKVTDIKDKVMSYTITLDRVFEFNRSYTINLKLRKENSYDSQFTILEPEIKETNLSMNHYAYNSYEMFILSQDTYTLNKEAESSVNIEILSQIPIEWTPSVICGSEFISVSKTDNEHLLVSAISENSGSINREAVIKITSFDGLHSKSIYLTQLCESGMQTIKFVPGTTNSCNIKITGTGLNIKYGQENQELQSGRNHTIPAEYRNSEITVTGSAIQKAEIYAAKATFENCTSLSNLTLNYKGSESIDISVLSSLREANLTGNNATGILFSEGQPINKLAAKDFSSLENLDLTKIAGHMEKLDIVNCDKLKSITIYNSEYTSERNLKFFSVSDCDIITGIGVGNYTNLKYINISNNQNLESLNISGCSSLGTLNLDDLNKCTFINMRNCTSLKDMTLKYISNSSSYCDIMAENTPAIENIYIEHSYLNGLDLSGHEKLVSVTSYNYSNTYIKDLNLGNCPSLKQIGDEGEGFYLTKLNIDNTPALERICIIFNNNTDTYLSAINSGAKKINIYNYNKSIDFTMNFTKAEELKLQNYSGTEFNLGNINTLHGLTVINNSSYYKRQIESMILPSSLKSLYISGGYDNSKPSGTLDLSAIKSLEIVDIDYTGITDIILSGIPALKSVDLSSCRTLKTVNASGTGLNSIYCNCALLETVNLDNCNNLEMVNVLNSKLSTLSIDNCGMIKELDASFGQLQYINFTTCFEIYNINLQNNIIDTENMNRIFTELPDRNNDVVTGKLNMANNPGAETCDKNIALNKNWYFVN